MSALSVKNADAARMRRLDMSRFEDGIRAAVEKLIAMELIAFKESVDPETKRKFRKLVDDLERELRTIRKAQVTIVVDDRAHEGDPMTYDTPDEGRRVEVSWEQANLVHELTTLRLHRVISEDAAEFVPAIGSEVTENLLPKPPYEMDIEGA
jgi:polysaccharide pyruvyl transferase WcaK-like protein